MPLDPDIASEVAHLFDATLAQVLAGEVAGPPAAPRMQRDDVTVLDRTVPGPGGPVPVRIYRAAALDPERPAPTVVWAHGGGWRFGGLDMPEADSVAQVIAATLPGVVASVDYRLAPAHRFPAPLDDVAAVQRWAADPAGRGHGIDPDRVALGGASAGAHLALAAALDHTAAGTPPSALLLAYPLVDPVGGPYPQQRPPDCPPLLWLDADAVVGLFAALVNDVDDPPPAAVPARSDLRGLPPILVTSAEYDALAPQGHRFVELARSAGVDVAAHHVDGVLHGYLNTVGASPLADRALARHVEWLRTVLGPR